jgi:hypothetical protein
MRRRTLTPPSQIPHTSGAPCDRQPVREPDLIVTLNAPTEEVAVQPFPSNRSNSSLHVLRWVIAAVGLVLGVVLLLAGNVVIGGLILVLAGLRIALLIGMERQRRRFAQATGGAGRAAGTGGMAAGSTGMGMAGGAGAAGAGMAGRPGLQLLMPVAVAAAARTIGVSAADLQTQQAAGRSMADIATDHAVPTQVVVDAVVTDASARLDQAVAAGRLPARRAERGRSRLPQWAHQVVTAPGPAAGPA